MAECMFQEEEEQEVVVEELMEGTEVVEEEGVEEVEGKGEVLPRGLSNTHTGVIILYPGTHIHSYSADIYTYTKYRCIKAYIRTTHYIYT